MEANNFYAFLLLFRYLYQHRYRFILSFDFLLIVSEKRPLTRQAKSAIQDTIFDQSQLVTGKISIYIVFQSIVGTKEIKENW